MERKLEVNKADRTSPSHRATKHGKLAKAHNYTITSKKLQSMNDSFAKVFDVTAEVLQNGPGESLTSVIT